jgi:hypothetical protein
MSEDLPDDYDQYSRGEEQIPDDGALNPRRGRVGDCFLHTEDSTYGLLTRLPMTLVKMTMKKKKRRRMMMMMMMMMTRRMAPVGSDTR